MSKYLLSLCLASLLSVTGCIVVEKDNPRPLWMGHPVSAEEFVAWVGSGSLYLPVYNDLNEHDVLNLNNLNLVVTTTIDDSGKLIVIDNSQIIYWTAWRDGCWQLELNPATNWKVRYNLAVMNGKIIGTVGEVNHGQQVGIVRPDHNGE